MIEYFNETQFRTTLQRPEKTDMFRQFRLIRTAATDRGTAIAKFLGQPERHHFLPPARRQNVIRFDPARPVKFPADLKKSSRHPSGLM
ncbi:hypothetical protein [Victivallis vadensis]|uniref:hypothetical protein n=1 Tax=Victivallis vadensis TaxID=172901 RepID=UPI00307D0856